MGPGTGGHGAAPDGETRGRPRTGGTTKVKKVSCFKLDAMSVPEALETTIRILLMFSIVLAHRRGTVALTPQPARECLLTTPGPPPDVVT